MSFTLTYYNVLVYYENPRMCIFPPPPSLFSTWIIYDKGKNKREKKAFEYRQHRIRALTCPSVIGSGFILYSAGGSSEWDAVIYSPSLLAWEGRGGLLICIFGEITASDLTARGKLEESQALRGIIQFRDFPVQGSRRIRFSKVQGFILRLYMSS